mgnify:CR=1 FL=1
MIFITISKMFVWIIDQDKDRYYNYDQDNNDDDDNDVDDEDCSEYCFINYQTMICY